MGAMMLMAPLTTGTIGWMKWKSHLLVTKTCTAFYTLKHQHNVTLLIHIKASKAGSKILQIWKQAQKSQGIFLQDCTASKQRRWNLKGLPATRTEDSLNSKWTWFLRPHYKWLTRRYPWNAKNYAKAGYPSPTPPQIPLEIYSTLSWLGRNLAFSKPS